MDPEGELADRLQIQAVVESYAVGADTRNGTLYADAFSDDGVLLTPTGEVRGRENLRAVPDRLAKYPATVHLLANHDVSFRPEASGRADGIVHCVAHHLYDTGEGPRVYVMMIRYNDEYVRVGGRWKISVRRLTLLWDQDHPARW